MKYISLTEDIVGENKVTTILIEKELSVFNVADVKTELEEVIGTFSDIKVQLKNIDSFDLAGIQLLIAIKKYCEKNNSKITFNIELTDDLSTIIENSGFDLSSLL